MIASMQSPGTSTWVPAWPASSKATSRSLSGPGGSDGLKLRRKLHATQPEWNVSGPPTGTTQYPVPAPSIPTPIDTESGVARPEKDWLVAPATRGKTGLAIPKTWPVSMVNGLDPAGPAAASSESSGAAPGKGPGMNCPPVSSIGSVGTTLGGAASHAASAADAATSTRRQALIAPLAGGASTCPS